MESRVQQEIVPYLPGKIGAMVGALPSDKLRLLEEIRLRVNRPLLLRLGDEEYALKDAGQLTKQFSQGYLVGEDDVQRALASVSQNSIYALEEELRRGFITLPGGHRVGLAGRVVLSRGEIKTMRDFSGLAFRVAREILGCAEPLAGSLTGTGQRVLNTLIVSPPRCGKTTLLRDLTRLFSEGPGELNVVVVDERSEIAACYRGVPQLNVGHRTDVLDGCPKALGVMMAVRSLSPHLIVVDEIGRAADTEALLECVNAGVSVIATAHGTGIEDVKRRPVLAGLLSSGVFEAIVVLSRRKGPGTVEKVFRNCSQEKSSLHHFLSRPLRHPAVSPLEDENKTVEEC